MCICFTIAYAIVPIAKRLYVVWCNREAIALANGAHGDEKNSPEMCQEYWHLYGKLVFRNK